MENIKSGYVKKRKSFSPKKQIVDKDHLFLVQLKHEFLRDSNFKFQEQINEQLKFKTRLQKLIK